MKKSPRNFNRAQKKKKLITFYNLQKLITSNEVGFQKSCTSMSQVSSYAGSFKMIISSKSPEKKGLTHWQQNENWKKNKNKKN